MNEDNTTMIGQIPSAVVGERNIYNIEEINQFIATLSEQAYREDVACWLQRNFRNYLIRSYPRIRALETVPTESPSWVFRDFRRRRKVYIVELDYELRTLAQQVTYFLQSASYRDISRMSVPDAIRLTAHWLRSMERRGTLCEDENGIFPVIEYDNGFRWVQVVSQQSLARESKIMRNCAASCFARKEVVIYSLRDSNNMPQITIEYRVDSHCVIQVKGRDNTRLEMDSPARAYFFHFMRAQEYMLGKHCYDVTGILRYNGRIFDINQVLELIGSENRTAAVGLLTRLALYEFERGYSPWYYEALRREYAGIVARVRETYARGKGDLATVLSLNDREVANIIADPENLGHPLFEDMLKQVLGIGLGNFKRYLTDDDLIALADSSAFRRFLGNNVSIARGLGLTRDDLERLVVRDIRAVGLMGLEDVDIKCLTYPGALQEFIRRNLRSEHVHLTSFVREILLKRVKLGLKETAKIVGDMPNLLPVLEPDPDRVPVEYFQTPTGATVLIRYCDAIYENDTHEINVVLDSRRAGRLLARVAITAPPFNWNRWFQRVSSAFRQRSLIGKKYVCKQDAEDDLKRLGVAVTASAFQSILERGLTPADLYRGSAAIKATAPKFLIAVAAVAVRYRNGRPFAVEELDRWIAICWILREWKRLDKLKGKQVRNKKSLRTESVFELRMTDILQVNDKGMQKLLHSRNAHTIAALILRSDAKVQDKILRNVSRRIATEANELIKYPQSIQGWTEETAWHRITSDLSELMGRGEIQPPASRAIIEVIQRLLQNIPTAQHSIVDSLWLNISQTDAEGRSSLLSSIGNELKALLVFAAPEHIRIPLQLTFGNKLEQIERAAERLLDRKAVNEENLKLALQIAARHFSLPKWKDSLQPASPPFIRKVGVKGMEIGMTADVLNVLAWKRPAQSGARLDC